MIVWFPIMNELNRDVKKKKKINIKFKKINKYLILFILFF
jgi:hypothetical protein